MRYPKTHNAFVKFVSLAASLPNLRTASRFTVARQFTAYTASLLDLAQKIEDLSPDGGDHPNPEYPWETQGVIVLPNEHSFADLDRSGRKMVKLLEFIDDCFKLT